MGQLISERLQSVCLGYAEQIKDTLNASAALKGFTFNAQATDADTIWIGAIKDELLASVSVTINESTTALLINTQADFDTDPMLLATPNQWVDLQSGLPHDPDPSTFVCKAIATDYWAKSLCPNFEAFLQDIFESDQILIDYMQRVIGYSLTGSNAEQCLLILVGDGANGKSTFVNVINKLLGDYSKAASSQTLVAKGSSSIGDDLVDLVSARLISVSETEDGEALAESKIKQMTGGDNLKGRPLYGSWLEFSIIGKIFLATNCLPQINNTDHGIWRRIQAIPFSRTFSADVRQG